MSRGPVGGYTVFPATLTRADLIAVTVEALELASEEVTALVFHDDDEWEYSYPSCAADVTTLIQRKSGALEVDGGTTIWFEPAADSYPLVTFWAYWRTLTYEYGSPEEVDSFVRRWLQLCEQGHALFGYFTQFDHMFDRDHLLEKILPAFEDGSVTDLLNETAPSWLIYLGTDLAERWRRADRPTPSPTLISQDLPSLAHFIRTSRSVDEC